MKEIVSVVDADNSMMLLNVEVANEPREASLGREYDISDAWLHTNKFS